MTARQPTPDDTARTVTPTPLRNGEAGRSSTPSLCSAVICDILGCRQHATGELQFGDEYIPLCELHRKAEMDRLMPKWRPLPPYPPNDPSPTTAADRHGGAQEKETNKK